MNTHKLEKLLKVELSKKQRRVKDCTTSKVNLMGVEGSGKTFIANILCLDAVLSGKTSTFFVCPSARQARDKQSRIFATIENAGLNEVLKRNVGYLMEFKNGSRIHFVSGEQKNSSVKGFHALFGQAKSGAVVVLIDDATSVRQEFADAIIATTFTASSYRLILCYNPTDTGSWVYAFHTAQERGVKDTTTFTFTPSDNPRTNKKVMEDLKAIDSRYEDRFGNRWDASKFNAFPPEILNVAIDDNYSLNLTAEQGFSYSMGIDLNDVLGESVGRDRDRACFLVLGKKVEETKTTYKVAGYDSFQRSTLGEWLECVKRFDRLYRLERLYVESPHASGLIESLKKEGLGDRIELCNPHRSNDIFSLKTAYDYLNTILGNKMLIIPHDAEALLKELRELKVEKTAGNEIRFFHKRHGHNDHVCSLAWVLLGMKSLEHTGSVNYDEIKQLNSRFKTRVSAMNIGYLNDIGGSDRTYLDFPSRRDMNDGYI